MQTAALDRGDVLGPRIDERHRVAGARKMTADVAANRAGADKCDIFRQAR